MCGVKIRIIMGDPYRKALSHHGARPSQGLRGSPSFYHRQSTKRPTRGTEAKELLLLIYSSKIKQLSSVAEGGKFGTCPRRIRFVPETYTFYARNVYVLTAKRIRFHHQTYTFCPPHVYVLLREPIPCPSLPLPQAPPLRCRAMVSYSFLLIHL